MFQRKMFHLLQNSLVFFRLWLWTTTFSREDGFTRRIRFQPNVTLLHSDRLVSTALSFIFLNVTDFKGIRAG